MFKINLKQLLTMNSNEILKNVKDIIIDELKKIDYTVLEVILFGSRAKGCEKSDSAWDFLIIVDKDIDFSTKKEVTMLIRRRLVKLGISSDLIIQSYQIKKSRENNIACLTYYAVREGIPL